MKVTHKFNNSVRHLFIEPETDKEEEFLKDFFYSNDETVESYHKDPHYKRSRLIFGKSYQIFKKGAKMKQSEILDQVYNAILHRPTNTENRWVVCWKDEKIQCLPWGNCPNPEMVFGKYTTHQLRKGLESHKWTVLEAKIYAFLKEKGLCKIQ